MSATQLPLNLKALRKKRKETQRKFASYLWLERGRYSAWEEGRSQPDIDNLEAMANLHNITVDDLLKKDLSEVEQLS